MKFLAPGMSIDGHVGFIILNRTDLADADVFRTEPGGVKRLDITKYGDLAGEPPIFLQTDDDILRADGMVHVINEQHVSSVRAGKFLDLVPIRTAAKEKSKGGAKGGREGKGRSLSSQRHHLTLG